MFNILSIEIGRLTKINENLNEKFIEELFLQIPHLGKKHDRYFIINNNLTINSHQSILHIDIFNLFLQNSRHKFNLIQIIKEPKK